MKKSNTHRCSSANTHKHVYTHTLSHTYTHTPFYSAISLFLFIAVTSNWHTMILFLLACLLFSKLLWMLYIHKVYTVWSLIWSLIHCSIWVILLKSWYLEKYALITHVKSRVLILTWSLKKMGFTETCGVQPGQPDV